MTPAEILLWNELRGRRFKGFKFRRQHPISFYIVDFYCHQAKLVIEADGNVHQSDENQTYDLNRTQVLESLGLKVIRFKNEEVLENLSWVLETIRCHLTPAPLLPGEGNPPPSPPRRRVGDEVT